MEDEARYKVLGELIAKHRKEIGITQAEFAQLIGSAQQTVCRWEQGITRPKEKQMPTIASALKLVKSGEVDSEELLIAAGYLDNRRVTTTFDQPFPINSLSWESFQRFCVYFLEQLYRNVGGIVHPNGGSGHTQDGLDIDVVISSSESYNFDCKRVKKFTASEVNEAVEKNTTNANKKVLLLTCLASPQARKEIKKHAPIWDIWDIEDISHRIRQDLSKDEQLKLVDIYFRGLRFPLLGELEAGPWQTAEEFFKPFAMDHHPFSHKWSLVGREDQVQEMLNALSDADKRLFFIVGTGGVGKSRFLKEIVEQYQSKAPEVKILFLSLTEAVTNKNFEDIGKSKKILIIDDAHEAASENIKYLLQYAADDSNNTKLLFSLRNYGFDFIKHQASLSFLLEEKYVSEVRLEALSLKQATELATQVLSEFNGPLELGQNIARFTKDCSLATVVGAKIVAQEKTHFEFSKNKDAFNNLLKGKFRNILLGEIGKKGDEEKIRKVLNLVALIQPFSEHDRSVADIVEQMDAVPSHEVNRLISLLERGGVLLKHAGMYRIVPDMLADFIIDETCRIEYNGASTGYAERVLDKSGGQHLKHVLVNLAKLDWRLTEGESSKSNLLDAIWDRLSPLHHVDAVTAIAYFQPRRALEFAESILRDGEYHHNLPELIKYAAYNLEELESACVLLWELCKREKNIRWGQSGHALRVLSELCEVRPKKVKEYSRKVVSFCLSLLEQEGSWGDSCTPFDVLKSIMKTQGRIYSINKLNFSVGTFSIDPVFVKELRSRVVNAAIALLTHKNIKTAVLAARFLESAISYHRPVSADERNKLVEWTEEFTETLVKIEQAIQANSFNKLVLIQIVDSVSWHAQYGEDEPKRIARNIINSLPDELDCRAAVALINGHPYHQNASVDLLLRETENKELLEKLTTDLLSAYPDRESLLEYIEAVDLDIKNNFPNRMVSSFILYESLVKSDLSFAHAILKKSLNDYNAEIVRFAGVALAEILKKDYMNGIKIAYQFYDTEVDELQTVVAYGYNGFSTAELNYTQDDIEILKKLLSSDKENVVLGAICAIRWGAKSNPRLVLDLLLLANIGLSNKIAEQAFSLFNDRDIPFHFLSQNEVQHFLHQLEKIPELDGHWVETFMANASKDYATDTAKFFMKRVEHSVVIKSWKYRACNYGPYNHIPLGFRESPDFISLFREVSEWWMSSNEKDNYFFHANAGHVFDVMFGPFNDAVVGFLSEWMVAGGIDDFHIISKILGESQNNFVFEYQAFVIRYLEKAKQFNDKDCYEYALSNLVGSVIRGVKAGSPGQPFPRDLELKRLSEKALSEIPKYSPSYVLYEQLKECADRNIDRSRKDGEYFEEYDELDNDNVSEEVFE